MYLRQENRLSPSISGEYSRVRFIRGVDERMRPLFVACAWQNVTTCDEDSANSAELVFDGCNRTHAGRVTRIIQKRASGEARSAASSLPNSSTVAPEPASGELVAKSF